MFNNLRNLFNNAVSTIRGVLTGGARPTPAAQPKPTPLRPLQQLPQYKPYIASWGDTPQRIVQGNAGNAQQLAASQAAARANAATLANNQAELQRQAAARAAEQEAARQREAARQAKQAQFDANQAQTRQLLGQGLNMAGAWLKKNVLGSFFSGSNNSRPAFDSPDYQKWYGGQSAEVQKQADFDKVKEDYAGRARQTVDQLKKNTGGGLFNWLSGGYGASQNAREFSAGRAQDLATNQIKRYETNLNAFQSQQASRKAQIESAKFRTQSEYDKAVADYSAWENDQIKSLEYARAATTGLLEGYNQQASAKLTDPRAKAASWFNQNVVHGLPGQVLGGIFKYTLGSGDKNVPSLTTAPARGMNTVTNLFRKPGDTIYDKSGNASKYDGNPWTTSFNQSNLNGSYASTSFDTYAKNAFLKAQQGSNVAQLPREFTQNPWQKAPTPKFDQGGYDAWLKSNKDQLTKQWQQSESNSKATYNVANDLALDPLSYLSGGGAKAGKLAGWLGDAAKSTKVGAGLFGAASKIAESKPVQWLANEHLNYQARKTEFIKQEVADIAAKKPLIAADVQNWLDNKNSIKVAVKNQIADRLRQQFGHLNDAQLTAWQQLVRSNGDWSLVKDAHKFNAGQRESLDMLANDYRAYTDKVHARETKAGIATPFRQNYIPQYKGKYSLTRLTPRAQASTGADWWFTKGQGSQHIQSKRSLIRSLAAREYSSKAARQDFPVLRNFRAGHEDLARNIERIQNVDKYVKRTPWEQAMRPFAASTSLWKKSVLKYRPAWVVNNVGYNIPAAMLAGGASALGEHARLLRPKNWKQAMSDVPAEVRSNLVNEIGVDKVSKFHAGVENWSRVSAWRAAKAKGLSDAEALKRVNKYLFNYKTRNFERPLKAVMPFYAWNKNLTRAAINMPFDRPLAAKAYNGVDRFQQNQYSDEFDQQVTPELTKLGYSPDEIKQIKEQNAKYYQGRLKVGNKWITTPFNAFSEKGLSQLGFNPYLTAAGEAADAVDSFGKPLKGAAASLGSRLTSKFPQAELAQKGWKAAMVQLGKDKPREGWIAKPGSEGYGLTKEKQGFDPSKKNYVASMDPRKNLGQDVAAFFGVPKGMEFDTKKLVEAKKLQKLSQEYFALDTKHMDYKTEEAAKTALFKKYGMTADQFYGGVLSKYDTENTTRIKAMKQAAADKNKALFDEYGKQPKGSRNLWATNKLRELNASGYFNDNPFLKSFNWVNPSSVAKADKQSAAIAAKKSGNWGAYQAKYGKSQKQLDYEQARTSGDWTKWRAKYGDKLPPKAVKFVKSSSPYQQDGKFFKSADSMQKYKDGQFWAKYATATKDDRKKLLADNPQYDSRKNWTKDQWQTWKDQAKAAEKQQLLSFAPYRAKYNTILASNKVKARDYATAVQARRKTKSVWT